MKINGNLFNLAEKRLCDEVDAGMRPNYTALDVIDYAIILRRMLDRFGKSGEIYKVRNVKTGKIVELETQKERRHQLYLRTGR